MHRMKTPPRAYHKVLSQTTPGGMPLRTGVAVKPAPCAIPSASAPSQHNSGNRLSSAADKFAAAITCAGTSPQRVSARRTCFRPNSNPVAQLTNTAHSNHQHKHRAWVVSRGALMVAAVVPGAKCAEVTGNAKSGGKRSGLEAWNEPQAPQAVADRVRPLIVRVAPDV